MARVDLYFGAGASTMRDWRRFVASIITPRFPDGLTSSEGRGQWRDKGRIKRERTRVLVIFYRPSRQSEARIEEIRTVYKRRFKQRSVLRVDGPACVSF